MNKGFITKLDFRDNRQVRQTEKTMTVYSGGSTFGLVYSAMTKGPNPLVSGVTETLLSVNSTFSGTSGSTTWTWGDPRMKLAEGNLSAVTLTSLGTSQDSGDFFTAATTTIFDGNLINLTYTGVSYDVQVLSVANLGFGNYSGNVVSNEVRVLTAEGLDFSGKTIWVDVAGYARAQSLIVTSGAVPDYVWMCTNADGSGAWKQVTGGSPAGSRYIVSGTYNNALGQTNLLDNMGTTISINGYFTGSTDALVTGGTFNSVSGIATFRNSTGGTFNVTGFTGTTIPPAGITGGTYNNGTATFINSTGGTVTVTGFFTGNTQTTPNLQQVTDVGNVTTNDIQVNQVYMYDADNTAHAKINANSGWNFYDFQDNLLATLDGNGSGVEFFVAGNPSLGFNLANTGVTLYRTLYIPDNSGVIPVSVNGFFANTAGNIQLAIPTVTGGSLTNGVVTFTNSTGGTFSVTGFTTGSSGSDVYVTGGTYNSGIATFYNSTGGTFNVTGFSSGTTQRFGIEDNTGVQNRSINMGNLAMTIQNSQEIMLGSSFSDNTLNPAGVFVTDTRISETLIDLQVYRDNYLDYNALSVAQNQVGLSSSIGNGAGTTQGADDESTFFVTSDNIYTVQKIGGGISQIEYPFLAGTKYLTLSVNNSYANAQGNVTIGIVTGGTYSNGTATFTNSTGGTFTVTGFNTVIDTYVTGATTNNSTKIYTFRNSTGGTFNVTGLTDIVVTGGTYNAGTLTLSNNTGGTFTVNGFSTTVDTYVTGGTPNNSTKQYTFTNSTGGTFQVIGLADINVTGGTYSNGTATFTNNTGGTFTINGFNTVIDTYVTGGTANNASKTYTFRNSTGGTFDVVALADITVTGGTANNATKTYTFTNNTGGTFSIPALLDITVTAGTYNNGVTTFTNSTGGTFTVTGFFTGATEVFVTGGTANNSTKQYIFTNNTGGTFNVAALTDITVTAGTYSAGVATFTNSTGGTFQVIGFATGTSSTDTFVTGGTYTAGTATFNNNAGGAFNVTGFTQPARFGIEDNTGLQNRTVTMGDFGFALSGASSIDLLSSNGTNSAGFISDLSPDVVAMAKSLNFSASTSFNVTPSTIEVKSNILGNHYMPISVNGNFANAMGEVFVPSGLITITKASADTVIAASALTPGQYYKITGVHTALYGGTDIILMATTTNTFELEGKGIFYNPRYNTAVVGYGIWNNYSTFVSSSVPTFFNANEAITNNLGGTGTLVGTISGNTFIVGAGTWTGATGVTGTTTLSRANIASVSVKSYSAGTKIIWGGYVWTNVNGNLGAATNILNLNSEWTKVAYNDVDYAMAIDAIAFDYANNTIIKRADKSGNVVISTFDDNLVWASKSFVGSPINVFQWGNPFVTTTFKGTGNNLCINSYMDCINHAGAFYNNSSNQRGIIQGNIIYGSNVIYNTIVNSGEIRANTLMNSYIAFNKLGEGNNNTTLQPSTINSNTLNAAHISNNELYITSTINSNTLDTAYILKNYLKMTSAMNSNRLFAGMFLYENTLNQQCSMNSNTIIAGFMWRNHLNDLSTITSNTGIVGNNFQIRQNELRDASTINSNQAQTWCLIQGNTLSNVSNINSNIMSANTGTFGNYIYRNNLYLSEMNSNTIVGNTQNFGLSYNHLYGSLFSNSPIAYIKSKVNSNILTSSILFANQLFASELKSVTSTSAHMTMNRQTNVIWDYAGVTFSKTISNAEADALKLVYNTSVTFAGGAGTGAVGAVTIPAFIVPTGYFIEDILLDAAGLTGAGAVLNMGVATDAPTAALNNITGDIANLNAAGLTKISPSNYVKATAQRLITLSVLTSAITAGTLKLTLKLAKIL